MGTIEPCVSSLQYQPGQIYLSMLRDWIRIRARILSRATLLAVKTQEVAPTSLQPPRPSTQLLIPIFLRVASVFKMMQPSPNNVGGIATQQQPPQSQQHALISLSHLIKTIHDQWVREHPGQTPTVQQIGASMERSMEKITALLLQGRIVAQTVTEVRLQLILI